MNKKGISDGYMLVIQLIAIGLIFTLLIYKVNQLDLDAIHRTIASKDLALSFSTISFLPGSFTFGGFTPEYANKLTKKEFYVKLSVDKIAYFEDIPSQNELKLSPDSYSFFSNKRVDYSDYLENEDADTMSYHDVRIKKSERVDLTNDRELGELDCRSESKKYYIKTLNICDRPKEGIKFCDDDGLEVCKTYDDYDLKKYLRCEDKNYQLVVDYDGFNPTFNLGSSVAYEAKGKTFEGRGEVELLRNHLGSENKYSIIKSLNEQKNFTKTILITFTENNEDDINIKIPFEYFEDNYGFACSFHNEVLRILFDEKTNYVDSVNILPTNSNSIIVELGNFENNEFVIKLFPKIMNKLMECGR